MYMKNPAVKWCKLCGYSARLIRVGENKERFAVICGNEACMHAEPYGSGTYGYTAAYFLWNRRNM